MIPSHQNLLFKFAWDFFCGHSTKIWLHKGLHSPVLYINLLVMWGGQIPEGKWVWKWKWALGTSDVTIPEVEYKWKTTILPTQLDPTVKNKKKSKNPM